LATKRVESATWTTGIGRGLGWALSQLCSLETLLVLFLFAAHLKILLPSTPMPETVFYGMASIGVGLWIVFQQGIYIRGLPIVVAGLLFSGWMFMSYGWSPAAGLARESLPFIFGVNLWALVVAACIVASSRERVMRLLVMIVLVAAVLGFIGTYIHVVHGSFRFYRGESEFWGPRVYLYWGNIVAIGAAIALGMVIYGRQHSLLRILAVATAGFGFFFVMASGARGAALGIMLAGLLVLLLNPPRIASGRIELPKAQLLAFAALAALLGYVGYLLATGQSTATIDRLLELFEEAKDPLLRNRANRFDYFMGAWRAWLDSPIFGQGLQGFRIFFCGYEAEGCYPHNAFLQVMADFGAVGLALFVALLWVALRHVGPRALRDDPLRTILFMAFVPIFFSSMVAGDLTVNHRLFFFLGLLAMRPNESFSDDDTEDDD